MSNTKENKKKTKKRIDLPKEKENNIDKTQIEKKNFSSFYVSYEMKIIIYSLLLIISLTLSIYLFSNSFKTSTEKVINYTEKTNLDYKVNLLPNNYYEAKSLEKDRIYIASLIQSIDTFYNYQFEATESIDAEFTYDIYAKILIQDSSEKNTYLEKTYPLITNKKAEMTDTKHFLLNDKITIDYQYYNRIASSFTNTYGIDTKNTLVIYLDINKKSLDKKEQISESKTTQKITMPLSEKSIEIKLDYKDVNHSSSIISKDNNLLKSILLKELSGILLLISIITIIQLIRLIKPVISKKNIYDKYINKILKEYDRLIVESFTMDSLDNYNIIRINKFEELLDARDNLKVPINYYVIAPHHKSYFYIVNGTTMYLLIVKDVDLENNN